MLVSLGAGVFSAPNEISSKAILANGCVIFIRRVRDNLSFGIGAGLTNSYGLPLILPMGLFNWSLSGKYEVNVNLANGMQVDGGIKFSDKFKLKLVPIEMDGMSSVMDVEGESMIYSAILVRSYLRPEYKIGRSSALYLGAGGTWFRGTGMSKRSLKDFLENFGGGEKQLDFTGSGYFTIGYTHDF